MVDVSCDAIISAAAGPMAYRGTAAGETNWNPCVAWRPAFDLARPVATKILSHSLHISRKQLDAWPGLDVCTANDNFPC